MKRGLGMQDKEIGDTLAKWNKGVLDSFLIEITRDIMYFNDDDGTPLLEKILDSAGQKGTGKWTAINALDLGMPVTLIAEAVLARCLSSLKAERTTASKKLEFKSRTEKFTGDKAQFLEDLEQALYASKIISYAQGFMLMQEVRFPMTVKSLLIPRRPQRSTSGSSTSHPSPSCGVEDASSDPSSSRTSPTLTAQTQTSRTCSSTISSTRLFTRLSQDGETSLLRPLSSVFHARLSTLLSTGLMVTAPRTYPPTFSRHRGITSVPTPSRSSQSTLPRNTQRARTFTSTGPDVVETSQLLHTRHKCVWVMKCFCFVMGKIAGSDRNKSCSAAISVFRHH